MSKQFLIIFMFFSLFACQEGKIYSEYDIEFIINEQLFDAVKSEYYRGNETRSYLNEVAQDKSEPFRSLKALESLKNVEVIDSSVAVILNKTSQLKESMIHQVAERQEKGTVKRDASDWGPLRINLDEEQLILPENATKKLESLKNDLFVYRHNLITKLAEYESQDSIRYYFNDPNIQSNSNPKSLMKAIDRAIEKSNVALDDKENIRRIYYHMTRSIVEFPVKIAEPIDYLNLLHCIERQVLSARADALMAIRLRRTGTDCRLDRYIPIVECPELSYVGDSVELRALLGAYDTSEDLSVMANGMKFESVKDGIAYQKVIIPNKKELVLYGTMTVRNKSGVPKVIPWQKKIKILPKEMKLSK